MYKRLLSCLPIIIILFSCVLALPEEDMGPVASVSEGEPTPVPLEQATTTVVFDLPDTPTPAPTATPTEVAQVPVAPAQASDFIYLQPAPQKQTFQRATVDEVGRAVLGANAIEVEQNIYVKSIRPSPKGDLAAVIFGTETGDYVEIYDFASGELFPLFRAESRVSSNVGYFLGWSHDSQFILFRPRAGFVEETVLLVEVATGYTQPLANLSAQSGTFSPDGQQVILDHEVWERDEDDGQVKQYGEVWLIELETQKHTMLFKGTGFHDGLTWSPNGHYVAYVGDCSEAGGVMDQRKGKPYIDHHGLCIMNADGTNRRLVAHFTSGGFYPIWSPDSRRIAFGALDGRPAKKPSEGPPNWNEMDFVGANIHILDVETGEERHLLTDSQEGNIDPAWSPDGSQILFTSKRSGSPEIWVINLDGTGLRQLTFDGQMKRHPLWSR